MRLRPRAGDLPADLRVMQAMVLPIYTYGQPVLRSRAEAVAPDEPGLQGLIDDMVETMAVAHGVGLAAPQVGRSLRLFVVDLRPSAPDVAEENGGEIPWWAREPVAFINPEIADPAGPAVMIEEGCLSIPDLREDVVRPDVLTVRFSDREFVPREIRAHGLLARVIQHELDHLDGVLFVDRVSPLRKRLLQRRLRRMAEGDVEADYPIVPPPAR
jgi:peptide deformylase